MREGDLDIMPDQMDRRVERLRLHLLAQQIQQAVLGAEFLAVENDGQRRIQIRIVAAHFLHEGIAEFCLHGKQRAIDLEREPRAVETVVLARLLHVRGEQSFGKLQRLGLALPPCLDLEKIRERVHRLDANPVESDRFLKSLAVILRAGVDLGRAVEKFPQRNPPPEVPHFNAPFLINNDPDLLAVAHDVLVDRIIHRLLEKDVNPVVSRGTVPQFSDIHPGPQADVLPPIK